VLLRLLRRIGASAAPGIEGSLGAKASCGQPCLVGGGGEFVVLVVGKAEIDPLLAAGEQVRPVVGGRRAVAFRRVGRRRRRSR
jgi:hypothetical protein